MRRPVAIPKGAKAAKLKKPSKVSVLTKFVISPPRIMTMRAKKLVVAVEHLQLEHHNDSIMRSPLTEHRYASKPDNVVEFDHF